MQDLRKIVIATSNIHKLREFRRLLEPFDLEVCPARPQWLAGVEETGHSFVENALIKARAVCAHTDSFVLADDSGLVVDALNGAPGIRSARYAGDRASDTDNNHKLLSELADCADRRAYFYCVLVVTSHQRDPCPLIFSGRWQGEIARAPAGATGFGYDPLFRVPGHGQTAAEMSPEKKNSLSHRGRATRQLLLHLCEIRSTAPARPIVAGVAGRSGQSA